MLNKFATAHNQFGPFELNVIVGSHWSDAEASRRGEKCAHKNKGYILGDRCNDQIGGELQSMVHIFTAPSIQMDKSYQLRGPHSRFKRLNPKNGAVSVFNHWINVALSTESLFVDALSVLLNLKEVKQCQTGGRHRRQRDKWTAIVRARNRTHF